MASQGTAASGRELGNWGEELAARHLESLGMVILARNWRCRAGEIDVVALDDGTLVVCEVKTRTTDAFGIPLAAVTPVKLRRLRRLAAEWLAESAVRVRDVRFDVVGILTTSSGEPLLEHIRGVA